MSSSLVLRASNQQQTPQLIAEHASTLRFLEILMENGPMTINALKEHVSSGHFTSEMRQACGWNEAAFKKLLSKYPSLFTLNDDLVVANDFHAPVAIQRSFTKIEEDCVDFFRSKLFKREDTWVPIVSLAGHLSQANSEIRKVVGPQSDFKKFLVRHPEAFVIKGQQVSLKVELPKGLNESSSASSSRIDDEASSTDSERDHLSTPDKNKENEEELFRHVSGMRVDLSTSSEGSIQSLNSTANPSTTTANGTSTVSQQKSTSSPAATPRTSKSGCVEIIASSSDEINDDESSPISIPSNEYKALMFIKSIIEKKGVMKIHNITGHFSQAHESIRNTIGWTKYELEEFLKKHDQIFSIDVDENVALIVGAKPNYVLTGRQQSTQAVRSLHQRRAKVFHVAKLWGIVDLGKHEHCFFDRSILPDAPDDLRELFKPGEYVSFNAVLSTKNSRAKWRATCVWKDADNPPKNAALNGNFLDDESELSTLLSEPELDWDFTNELSLYQDDLDNFYKDKDQLYYDQKENELLKNLEELHVPCTLPDSLRNKITLLADLYKDQGYQMVHPEQSGPTDADIVDNETREAGEKPRFIIGPRLEKVEHSTTNMVDQACQTLSTGDILATQLFYPK